LRNFGLKGGMVGKVGFEPRIKELVENFPVLAALLEPLLSGGRFGSRSSSCTAACWLSLPLLLSLSESEIDATYAFAQPLNPDLRGRFLEGVARLLRAADRRWQSSSNLRADASSGTPRIRRAPPARASTDPDRAPPSPRKI